MIQIKHKCGEIHQSELQCVVRQIDTINQISGTQLDGWLIPQISSRAVTHLSCFGYSNTISSSVYAFTEEQRVNDVMLSEVLRSAFPWRCCVAVRHSGICSRTVVRATHADTVQICFVQGGTASLCSSHTVVTGQCSFSNSRNGRSSRRNVASALHLFMRRGCRIQSAAYKLCRSMCGHLREALSFWIWLLLNWHCSSPHSE